MKPYRGPPMTLGNAAAAQVRLIVWCLDCRHQVEPDPVEQERPVRQPGTDYPRWPAMSSLVSSITGGTSASSISSHRA